VVLIVEATEINMIESIADLHFEELDEKAENFYELVDAKLQEKLGITLLVMQESLCKYVSAQAEEIALELPNIAPNGDYSKLIEDNDGMATFLKEEVAKPNVWILAGAQDYENKSLFKFEFLCKAVDEGKTLIGKVFISKSGVIRHAFVVID
jgi:hypothetical protein